VQDEHELHVAETAPAAAPAQHPEVAELQERLKRAIAECDRHVSEKADVLRMADTVSRERDDLRQRFSGLSEERDKLLSEAETIKQSFVDERDRLLAEAETVKKNFSDAATRAESMLREATGRADAAVHEAGRLAQQLASKETTDSLKVLWDVACKETTRGLAFLRSKIPKGHPGQKWFDVTVETVTTVGCLAVQAGAAFVKWATPRVQDLAGKAMVEAEKLLAKK
jgi:hypothetical protein